MTRLRVWAPRPAQVAVTCGGQIRNLVREESGWWSLEVPELEPGVDYAFLLDGKGPYPDPRSRWQPQGVEGPSRWLEPDHFVWTDAAWRPPPLAAAVILEVHVGTCTPGGRFRDLHAHLAEWRTLGITHLELMPIGAFAGRVGWGYDVSLPSAPHPDYGDPAELCQLVDACHATGLAVLLDVVYNHLGPSGTSMGQFAPYTRPHASTPWGEAMNLDGPGSDEVRSLLLDNARLWLADYHFDGLRIDAEHALVDRSALPFLEELAGQVRQWSHQLARPLSLIVESDRNDSRLVLPLAAGGMGMDALWNEDFHHALHALLTGERYGPGQDFGHIAHFARVWTHGFALDGRHSRFRGRRHGRPASQVPGRRFVAFLQNHDQIGNRPGGERSARLLSTGQQRIASALLLSSPFIPLLFQGEEWGAQTPFHYFAEFADPHLAQSVRTGRHQEFLRWGWPSASSVDPADPASFAASRLDWSERAQPAQAAQLAWIRALLNLRSQLPEWAGDDLALGQADWDETARWLWLRRGATLIACNFSTHPQVLPQPDTALRHALLSSDPAARLTAHGLELPAESVLILRENGP